MKRLRKITAHGWESQARGSRKANSNKPKPEAQRKLISEGVHRAAVNHAGKILEGIKTGQDNEVQYFKNGAEAARFLGCSKQLVSQAVKCQKGYSARGWVFKWVELKDMLKFDK